MTEFVESINEFETPNKELIILEHGICPNNDYNVLAYGKEAVKEALNAGAKITPPIHWDGFVSHTAVGGKYCYVDPNTNDDKLKQIQSATEYPDNFPKEMVENELITTISDDGVESMEILDI